MCFLLCGWYWSPSPSSPKDMLRSFSIAGVVLKSRTVLCTSCGCTSQNPWRVVPLFSRTTCFLCILVTTTLNLVPSAGLKCHCCLHLRLFGIPMDKLKRRTRPQLLVSGGSKGSFNIRGKKRQHQIPWVTLYELFLKNKVNKTWDTKPWILITCLRLWGGRGDAARVREAWVELEVRGWYLNAFGHVMALMAMETVAFSFDSKWCRWFSENPKMLVATLYGEMVYYNQ